MKNFGEIKNRFSNILIESIIKKNDSGKNTFGKFVKMLKENEILKTQYFIYDSIENKHFDSRGDAKDYIKESIGLLSKYSKKQILATNKKLASLLSVNESKDYPDKELHQNITNIIFTVKSSKTLDVIHEAFNKLSHHMTAERIDEGEKRERIDLPPSVLTKMVVNRFNSKYDDISESEKKILKTILNGTEEDKKNVYTELLRECLDVIDEKLTESGVDLKGKLLSAKDKLLRMDYVVENYNSVISKIYQLKESIETE